MTASVTDFEGFEDVLVSLKRDLPNRYRPKDDDFEAWSKAQDHVEPDVMIPLKIVD